MPQLVDLNPLSWKSIVELMINAFFDCEITGVKVKGFVPLKETGSIAISVAIKFSEALPVPPRRTMIPNTVRCLRRL